MQRGPDRNLVLESRGLLEGQLKKVGAKFGSQGGCNSSVVVRAAHSLAEEEVCRGDRPEGPSKGTGTGEQRVGALASEGRYSFVNRQYAVGNMQ